MVWSNTAKWFQTSMKRYWKVFILSFHYIPCPLTTFPVPCIPVLRPHTHTHSHSEYDLFFLSWDLREVRKPDDNEVTHLYEWKAVLLTIFLSFVQGYPPPSHPPPPSLPEITQFSLKAMKAWGQAACVWNKPQCWVTNSGFCIWFDNFLVCDLGQVT